MTNAETVPVETLRRLALEWRERASISEDSMFAAGFMACACDIEGLIRAAEAGALTDGSML